jgi:hypothetical protein
MIVKSAIKQDSIIYTGHRHPNIIHAMVELGLPTPIRGEQGFVDENGVFYNRIDAAAHAIECGQIVKLNWPPNLYSEDLY